MDKLPTRLACLSLMFGSGAAWSAVQAGDGAMRAQPDVLAKLAHDSARVEQLAAASATAAAGAPTPSTSSALDTASASPPPSTSAPTPTHTVTAATAMTTAPAPASALAFSSAPTPAPGAGPGSVSASVIDAHSVYDAAMRAMSSIARDAQPDGASRAGHRYIAPDAIAVDLPASAQPSSNANNAPPVEDVAAQVTTQAAATPTMSTADATRHTAPDVVAMDAPAQRDHAPAHTRLSGSRITAPPSPNVIASLGTVTVGGDADGQASASSATTTELSASTRDNQGIAGIAIEPAGAPVAKAMPLEPDRHPDGPLSRTTDPLPLAPAGAATTRTAWSLSTPAPLANEDQDGKNNKDGSAPRAPTEDRNASGNWSEMKVSDARLDEMRGGFDVPNGLQIAFGIERAVFVNGQLVATTSFNIPNIAQMTIPQAQQLAQALNTTTLVQSGPNNVAPNIIPGASAATIVQNTLNNQAIKALTTINTAVNSLAAFKQMNLQSTINSAIANTVLPR